MWLARTLAARLRACCPTLGAKPFCCGAIDVVAGLVLLVGNALAWMCLVFPVQLILFSLQHRSQEAYVHRPCSELQCGFAVKLLLLVMYLHVFACAC